MKRSINAVVLFAGLVLATTSAEALAPAECRAAWDRSEASQVGNWSWAGGAWTVERCDDVRADVVRHQKADGTQEEMCRISARCTNGPSEEPSRYTFVGPPEKVECLAHWPIGSHRGLTPDAC